MKCSLYRPLVLLVLFATVVSSVYGFFYPETGKSGKTGTEKTKACFCELKGSIDDCSCNVDTVDHFNNVKIYPRLQSLLIKDYFRFYKVNLKNECPFWSDDSKCAMKFCHVQKCKDTDIPEGIKGHVELNETPYFKYSEESQQFGDCNAELSFLNTSISDTAHEGFVRWADYDAAEDNFCILDDQQEGAEYVDLLLNPERYTGYRGESAHRVWSNIYMKNCFIQTKTSSPSAPFVKMMDLTTNNGVCLEQRAFYRLISGLHSSINVHLCSNYLVSEKKDFMAPNGIWGRNIDEFKKRFSPDTTNHEGTNWIRNLYFAYIVELRALAKAAPYLKNEKYFTGDEEDDAEVRLAVKDLLTTIESFPSFFNESLMFTGGPASSKLKIEFREKFLNISRIMDCVGCDKCRLWGKLQTQGMGTALKILFSEKFNATCEECVDAEDFEQKFKLRRTEIVSLFNAFGRLSNSIYQLEEFRKVLRPPNHPDANYMNLRSKQDKRKKKMKKSKAQKIPERKKWKIVIKRDR